jgi:hypothetical protein
MRNLLPIGLIGLLLITGLLFTRKGTAAQTAPSMPTAQVGPAAAPTSIPVHQTHLLLSRFPTPTATSPIRPQTSVTSISATFRRMTIRPAPLI